MIFVYILYSFCTFFFDKGKQCNNKWNNDKVFLIAKECIQPQQLSNMSYNQVKLVRARSLVVGDFRS